MITLKIFSLSFLQDKDSLVNETILTRQKLKFIIRRCYFSVSWIFSSITLASFKSQTKHNLFFPFDM